MVPPRHGPTFGLVCLLLGLTGGEAGDWIFFIGIPFCFTLEPANTRNQSPYLRLTDTSTLSPGYSVATQKFVRLTGAGEELSEKSTAGSIPTFDFVST